MNDFEYIRAASVEEALEGLGSVEGARLMAGGTDLLPLMKDEIVSPGAVVDISAWKDGAGIELREDGLHIGALAPLSSIAVDESVVHGYAALADACKLAASPQLRNMGTLGGNLLQQTRCWYYRGPYDCWLKGGDTCFAREGENEYHSIFATEPEVSRCVSAHPSDPAVALMALAARVRFRTAGGEGEMSIEELYALPEEARRSFVTLPDGAVLTEITLPPAQAQGRSVYVKAMARAAWAFALAGVALYVDLVGSEIREARIALGGVAPVPLRSGRVEAELAGARLDEVDASRLAELLVEVARPLPHNGYKITLLRGLFKEALGGVLGQS
jgi:xanthine dehydrogenase YagS FAD-binding subunit